MLVCLNVGWYVLCVPFEFKLMWQVPNMYTILFEHEKSGQNSPSTDLGVLQEDPILGLASGPRQQHLHIVKDTPCRGLGPQ